MRGGILRERWCWCLLWGNNRAPVAGPLMQDLTSLQIGISKTLGFSA